MAWWKRQSGNKDSEIGHDDFSACRYKEPQDAATTVEVAKPTSISVVAKALLVTRRRLRLDPARNLYFLYEPGKQVSSAVKMKNTSRSNVAFKFQTNAPKCCFMRPPNGILSPGETTIITIVKFLELHEQHQQKRGQDKFKIVSLKVKEGTKYASELFTERREFVAVERVLREIEKLKKRLAEAEALLQARKKPSDETDRPQDELSTTHQEK